MMFSGGNEYGYGNMMGGWFGGLLVLLFGALVIAGIATLVMWFMRSR